MPTIAPPKVTPPKVSPPAVSKRKLGGRGSWRTALVVDADPDNRQRVIRLLREAAGESPDKPAKFDAAGKQRLAIHEAEDGPAAWALIEVVKPDLVVAEILLEGLSGLQLLRRMRDKYGKDAPVVFFVTEMSNEVDRYWALRNGAGAYVIKPYEDELLRKRSAKLFEEGDEGGLELDSWPIDP
jgi:twitching motility two-component system response regulator PilH